MGKTSLYFPTWASPWVAKSSDMDLAKLTQTLPGVGIVYLSFADPTCIYVKQQRNFNGTGIQFSQDFSVVVGAIKILKDAGVVVMLSVGGGAYWNGTKQYNAKNCVDLMNDLGCQGIDIDWEGYADRDYELTDALISTKKHLVEGQFLCFAGFSTGAYGKDGDTYKGSAIHAMTNANAIIDWINIMAYDAGSAFDPLGAFDCYKLYYGGALYLGFQPGTQSWGGHLTTEAEVKKHTKYVKDAGEKHGIFVWCYGKTGTPNASQIMSMAFDILKGGVVAPPPVVIPPVSVVDMTCPVCKTGYKRV
jgi:hypothetical protein